MIDISRNPKNEEVSSMWWEDLCKFLYIEEKDNDSQKTIYHFSSKIIKAINKAKEVSWGRDHEFHLEENEKIAVNSYMSLILKAKCFEKIVRCPADQLQRYAQKYKRYHYQDNFTKALSTGMTYLYESFTRKKTKNGDTEAAKIMESLGIKTCPYCNREYTFTLYGKDKKTRPEFDHFYNKTDYPILALSFFNLVPSCHVCNHIKGTNDVKVNPYVRGFKSKLYVEGFDKSNKRKTLAALRKGDVHIKFEDCNSDDNINIKELGLDKLYEQHKDYVSDLIDKAYAYDYDSREYLADAFQGKSEMPSQVYNFVWGTYFGAMQDNNWPLAKLTKDILEQLGINR